MLKANTHMVLTHFPPALCKHKLFQLSSPIFLSESWCLCGLVQSIVFLHKKNVLPTSFQVKLTAAALQLHQLSLLWTTIFASWQQMTPLHPCQKSGLEAHSLNIEDYRGQSKNAPTADNLFPNVAVAYTVFNTQLKSTLLAPIIRLQVFWAPKYIIGISWHRVT